MYMDWIIPGIVQLYSVHGGVYGIGTPGIPGGGGLAKISPGQLMDFSPPWPVGTVIPM